ncbi:hypothetical protein [Flammeovirga sp. EKP202]|uniref:hypothetical protein n=1 Tax=Flammeovirga sp. EKP202 TaxID=2770592 RepID=UPI00166000D2|nr:hypothetical protein [Flammeovirga sp. EKP202]MBD0401476.1 hypothetical protein [Flammeovirga sp. EKP202]
MKHNIILLFTIVLTTTFFSCTKEEDKVTPINAQTPENLNVELIDQKATFTWTIRSAESYTFQLAMDQEYTDVIFDQMDKKRAESPIEIDSAESDISKGKVMFKNVPFNHRYHFRVRAEIIDTKTGKSTSTSDYSMVNFIIEDKTKPAIPTTKVSEDQISFASFNLDFPEGFDPNNELDIELEVSKEGSFSNSMTFRYSSYYGANATNLTPNTQYYYRVIPSEINQNVSASEASVLTTHSMPLIEMDKFNYRTTGGGPNYFTLEFEPQNPEQIILATTHGNDLKVVSEVSTKQDFEINATISDTQKITIGDPPYGYFKTADALGSTLYGRAHLKVGSAISGEYSNILTKEMPNAIGVIDGNVLEFEVENNGNERLLHFKNRGEANIEIFITLENELEDNKENKVSFNSESGNKFSIKVEGREFKSSQNNLSITLYKNGQTIRMDDLIQSVSFKITDGSESLNLYHFGLGIRS